jgi:SagB-type dehydrogenase family enzyme
VYPYPYRQILARMRSGDTDRGIARSGLMARHKIAALRRVAECAGWLDPDSSLPEDSVVLARLHLSGEASSSERGVEALGHGARQGSIERAAQEWYVAEGEHGQRLLAAGQVEKAAEVFGSLLARLGEDPSYARAVVLGRLARCFYIGGRNEQAMAHLQEALGVIEELAPSDALRALRGTLHSERGEVFRAAGQHDEARQEFRTALRIAEELQDLRAQGVDLSQLGTLALARGDKEEALERCRSALALLRRIHEPALEAAAWHQLGVVFQDRQQWQEAEQHYLEAARIREQHGQLAAAQQSWNQLGLLNQQAGRAAAAEAWYRKAVEAGQKSGNRMQLGSHLTRLADLLQSQPGRLDEARQLAEAALGINKTLDLATAQLWQTYGVLAGILAAQAAASADDRCRAELEAQARDYCQLHQYTPRFLAALTHLGAEASYARAVVLGRLARCFYMSGHNEQAMARLQEALGVIDELAPSESLRALRCTLHSELGEVFRAMGQRDRARQAFGAALRIAEELQDLRAQGVALSQLGTLALEEGDKEDALEHCRSALALLSQIHEPALEAAAWHQLGEVFQEQQQCQEAERHYLEAARIREQHSQLAAARQSRNVESGNGADPPFQITLDEEQITDYGLDGDLLVDGPRERRIGRWAGEPHPLTEDLRPMLAPCVRVCMDDDGGIRFCLPLGEPVFERHRGCIVIRRLRREIRVAGISAILWQLIGAMDGNRHVAGVLLELPPGDRQIAARLVGALTAAGAIDISGRPIARFVHAATKKGVMPAGGLEGDEVLQLVMDGDQEAPPGASRIALSQAVPERLHPLHALTRSRRSRRDFNGLALSRSDFDALLHTACGVTGAMQWAGREVHLRAYPASGGLYAVQIYPVALRVEDLAPGVYRYRCVENCLDVVKNDIDRAVFVDTMLPAEREMVAGAAAMVCLTGRFARHERKYGEGGYRMLVAETGHISQNLILTAVALGLSARPFGGVFDDLLNRELGLDCDEEQFLLAVLVGHAGAARPGKPGSECRSSSGERTNADKPLHDEP